VAWNFAQAGPSVVRAAVPPASAARDPRRRTSGEPSQPTGPSSLRGSEGVEGRRDGRKIAGQPAATWAAQAWPMRSARAVEKMHKCLVNWHVGPKLRFDAPAMRPSARQKPDRTGTALRRRCSIQQNMGNRGRHRA
jgi:hypothetical protein